MDKTKIEWCESTWNPVTGCRHGCDYCYARRIAERFSGYDPQYGAGLTQDENGNYALRTDERKYRYNREKHKEETAPYPFGFEPTFYGYRLDQPKKWKEPRTVFVCSMADLFGDWVPWEWIRAVFEAADAAPQHRYIFLTKNPRRYLKMRYARVIHEFNERHPDSPHAETEKYKGILPLPRRENWWFGSSVDSMESRRAELDIRDNTFVSIEPLTERLDVGPGSFGGDRWIIIGAETGNRKGKVTPQKEWIDTICEAADITHAAVFMKDSLIPIMGEENMRREFPWGKGRKEQDEI